MNPSIPVNTFAGLGTKAIFHTAPIDRSLGSGCILLGHPHTALSIESGQPVRIFIHKKTGGGGTLLNGDVVEILNVCGNDRFTARFLAVDDYSSIDKNVIWKSFSTRPADNDFTASWRVVDTTAPIGQPLEILQSLHLFSAQYPDQVVSVYKHSNMQFHLATYETHGPFHSHSPSDPVSIPIPVDFYFSSPSYLPTQHIPQWVLDWFPGFANTAGNAGWLTAWSQHSPLHNRQRKKWNDIALSRRTPPAPPGLGAAFTASPSPRVEPPRHRTAAEMWKAARTANATIPHHVFHHASRK